MKEEGQCNELGVLCIIMYIIAINLPMFASEHALQIKEKICFFPQQIWLCDLSSRVGAATDKTEEEMSLA